MVAIVNQTGAENSTIINLHVFYDVTAGSVSPVDGHDIRNPPCQDYRVNSLVWKSQDAWLFEGNYRENLRFGNLEATGRGNCWKLLRRPMCGSLYPVIPPGGYNMEMNQESSNISLGQKQLWIKLQVLFG